MAVEDSIAQDQIRAFIERIERMEEEKAAISADIKEIYAEAKGNGFDTKILRKVVTIRKQDANERMEQEALLDLYMGALGMIAVPTEDELEERDRLNRLAAQVENATKPKADPTAGLRANPDLHIVSASDIKPKSEPQPLTQAGSDLAASQALNGQVVPHSDIETPISNEAPMAVDGDSVEDATAPLSESVEILPGGDMAAKLDGAEQPPAAPKYAAPGIVTYENHPPEGVERSAISIAFGNMGQDGALIQDDLANGRAQPIVKQGNVILDGWARYMTARTMTELDGSPLTYAVVQHDGTDPLIDVIRWNVEGRMLNEQQKRVIAQTLTRQHPKRKDDIYRAFELWMEPV